MANSPKASPSIVAAAVVAILAGLVVFLCTSLGALGISLTTMPSDIPPLPPVVRTAALITLGVLASVSLFGIATGIGLLYLRNWARISILIWGALSVFFGAVGIPIVIFTSLAPSVDAPNLPAESMQLVHWILTFVYGLPLILGVWWLVLFNHKAIKAQFAAAAGSSDPGVPRRPRCPLPIAVLAWFYVSSILNLLFLPFLPSHVPLFVFGWVLPGSVGLTVLIVSCLAFFVCGVGLLKLKPWSYTLTMGLQLFWLASTVVSVLSPNYKAVMDSFLKEMQASMHLPETQFSAANFSHNYGWTVVLGLLFAGAILGLLVYYRPRFLEAATATATSS